MPETAPAIDPQDRNVLRELVRRRQAIVHDPLNAERRDLWLRFDAGERTRPMVLAEVGGIRDAVNPLPESDLRCRDAWARGLEKTLRQDLYQFEVLRDDHVVEPCWRINWQVAVSNYGVQSVSHTAADFAGMGARAWDPPLRDLDRDFALLRPRTYSVDRAATLAAKTRLEELFGDLMPVQIRGGFWWTTGMTIVAIDLIGLEGLMLAMFDNPAGLHRLMAFLRDDQLAYAHWLEREGLLTLNNANDYIGSGSMGYTRRLPQPDWQPGSPVRLKDLWVLSESQETVGVGPDQFAEFIFPYQHSIVSQFGLCYYGCCEPVHSRLHILRQLPNLARISVSPWADEAFMARELGRDIVYSRKPSPAMISTSVFDEAAIRADLRQTLTVARDCRVELIMKDVHTLGNQPWRLPRWVELARQISDELA